MPKHNVQVKICGITNKDDALWAANLGADYIGLNFCAESPRKVSVAMAADICKECPPFVKTVGVFMNPDPAELEKNLKKTGIQIVQLHGAETPEQAAAIKDKLKVKVWKAIRVENADSLNSIASYAGIADAILLDAFHPDQAGGTGQVFDWELAVKAKDSGIPVILAGGLNPDNVTDAIKKVLPQAVDSASGVEKEGHPKKKDLEKMKSFLLKAKS